MRYARNRAAVHTCQRTAFYFLLLTIHLHVPLNEQFLLCWICTCWKKVFSELIHITVTGGLSPIAACREIKKVRARKYATISNQCYISYTGFQFDVTSSSRLCAYSRRRCPDKPLLPGWRLQAHVWTRSTCSAVSQCHDLYSVTDCILAESHTCNSVPIWQSAVVLCHYTV